MAKRKSKDKTKGEAGELSQKSMGFPLPADFPFPFEPDMMQEIMSQLLDELELSDEDQEERDEMTRDKKSPLAKAQKLIYQAAESFDPDEQRRLALKALTICGDCVDAYCLLAEQAESEDEALDQYRQGVIAGERALGEPFFSAEAGRFWSVIKCRPYMRARLGLALQLWQAGQSDECLDHLRELIRLNVTDEQGARFYLASYLLQLGCDQELSELVKNHDDDSVDWLFHKAILAFRAEGDTPRSRELLQKAATYNPHVAAYMVDFKPLPLILPEFTSMGDEGEAMHFTANNRAGWKTTAGAIPWLRKVLNPEFPAEELENLKSRTATARKIDYQALRELPQTDEVWQIDQVCAPIELDEDGEVERLDQ